MLNELSLFFPAYNEEANLEETVNKAIPILKKTAKKYEIIIINDGSKDKTGQIAKQLAKKHHQVRVITHQQNRGYGAAFKSGLYNSKFAWIAFTDADGQFDFSEVKKFIKKQQETKADLVIGYYLKRQVPFFRILGSKVWEWLVFLLFGLKVKDTDCGFKFFKKEIAEKIPQLEAERGPFINSEFLIKAKNVGFKIVEIGVHHYPRKAGKATGASLKVIWSGFKDLLRLRGTNWELLILVLILLLAAFLRLYKISGYMTFLGDEGRDALVVKRMIVNHKWTLLGPTASVGGFFLGPFYYYLMIPFLWFWRLDPTGAAVMVALFGVATVFLIYLIGKKFFNAEVGLLAAGLYATSPFIIVYSRSSWNPNLMPFFSLLAIYSLYRAVEVKKTLPAGRQGFWLGLVGFCFGLALQLHYLTVFLMIIAGVYWLIFSKERKNYRFYLWFFAGLIAGWSPFLLFELRHQFPNLHTIYRFLLFGEETGFMAKKFFPTLIDVLWRLWHRLVTHNYKILTFITLLISLFSFIFSWFKEKRQFKTYSLIGLWLVLGVGLFGFYQKGIYDYYFGFMYPLPFLLTALALVKAGQKHWVRLPAIVLAAAIFVVHLNGISFRYPPNQQMAQAKQIARVVFDKAGGKPFNFGLITGNNSDHAYRYFLELWGNPPITIENFDNDPQRKTVTDQLLVVCESLPCFPEGHSLWEIAGFGQAKIIGEWNVSFVKIYKLEHYKK